MVALLAIALVAVARGLEKADLARAAAYVANRGKLHDAALSGDVAAVKACHATRLCACCSFAGVICGLQELLRDGADVHEKSEEFGCVRLRRRMQSSMLLNDLPHSTKQFSRALLVAHTNGHAACTRYAM